MVNRMKGILCDISALRYHARTRATPGARRFAPLERVPADCLHNACDAQKLYESGALAKLHVAELPLHVLVPSAGQAQSNRYVVCHSCQTALPANAVQHVADSLFCLSPAGCFLFAARRLTVAQLVAFGCQLCGSFAVEPDGGHALVSRAPVASAGELRAFLAQAPPRVYGLGKARTAAGYVRDGLRSPREVLFGMLCALPPHMGGFGLGLEANRTIELSSRAACVYGRATCVCDFFHDGAQVDIEVDGAYHRSAGQQARDALRQDALLAMGIALVRVTGAQAADLDLVGNVAALVAKRARAPLPPRDEEFHQRQERLLKEVGELDRALFGS